MDTQPRKKILLVEDDPNFGMVLKAFLEIKKFDVTLCKDGGKALIIVKNQLFDFFILDVMLPNKDGFSIAKELKDKGIKTPFIFLTARIMKEDKVKGFELGALDYLEKPFDPDILYLKIQALLGKQSEVVLDDESTIYEIGNFKLDVVKRVLVLNDIETKLTYKESELLKMLIAFKDNILLRSQALSEIWGDDNYFTTKSMDVYITKLRKYLKSDKENKIEIQNIHGKGFRLILNE
ncbi:DNA-binding response regulator, OmpR family, contains REC and winged-helix (wHTH) domain [Tenacibaculum sp. MAR_2009_124]|uniref:response regulator transcription factor n=1 Tax=Tenacibaculum sp. MAR_2009_124 TaxID=1250059 RepID=UPI0008956750|nr:response regulator transcription factor [Tenacibaculum sp. MAR_2009_124]SEC79453.1 DNA-binding response regulator, OmpR family, contains REC and winged-helix (wHTH) domain [Tenacibaculum sp. MAR_2009_124]